jgi:hypothetical protein
MSEALSGLSAKMISGLVDDMRMAGLAGQMIGWKIWLEDGQLRTRVVTAEEFYSLDKL